MRTKVAALSLTALYYFLNPLAVFADTADNPDQIDISIKKTQDQGINPGADVGTVIGNAVAIIFVVAVLVVLFMLVLGAFNWITSGGDKEAVAKARNRIINALIGLLLLAVAFLIARVAGQLVHIDIFHLQLPALDKNAVR